MTSSPLVELTDVTKVYRLGRERHNLRAALPGRFGRRVAAGAHVALQNVTLRLSEGDSLGIVGPNGAGKSTLLKLVSRVIAPTYGSVRTRGRIASLIELGVGFHPDLTGRENLRFAGAVQGLGTRQLALRLDDIVAFAGIEPFLDTPVKRYSSGMLARLGFALASSIDADVLVIDEVLAVGDAAFQRKSYERLSVLRKAGVAVLMVSHNLWAVSQLCERALQLDRGMVINEGAAKAVVEQYRASSEGTRMHEEPVTKTAGRIDSFQFDDTEPSLGGTLRAHASITVYDAIQLGIVVLTVTRPDGLVCTTTVLPQSDRVLASPGSHAVVIELRGVDLTPGAYRAWFSLVEEPPSGPPLIHDQAVLDLVVRGDVEQWESDGIFMGDWLWCVRAEKR